jgi:hypothetical protein
MTTVATRGTDRTVSRSANVDRGAWLRFSGIALVPLDRVATSTYLHAAAPLK